MGCMWLLLVIMYLDVICNGCSWVMFCCVFCCMCVVSGCCVMKLMCGLCSRMVVVCC